MSHGDIRNSKVSESTRRLNPHLFGGDNRGSRPVIQKPEALRPHREESQATDDSTGESYRLRFVFRVSDAKVRDGDGMLATVSDCLVRAIGRFVKGDS